MSKAFRFDNWQPEGMKPSGGVSRVYGWLAGSTQSYENYDGFTRAVQKIHDGLAVCYLFLYVLWAYLFLVNLIYFGDIREQSVELATRPFLGRFHLSPLVIIVLTLLAPAAFFVVPMLVRSIMRLFLPTQTLEARYDNAFGLMLSPPRLIRRLTKGRYVSEGTNQIVRGAQVAAYRKACEKAKRLVATHGTTRAFFRWGTLPIPVDRALAHFALLGMSRSGKTTVLRLMMQDILPPTFAKTKNFPRGRAVVFDPKSEFFPLLIGMGVPEERIFILNPFDERCSPWDLAADIESEADALAIADLLVESGNEGTSRDAGARFYQVASRNVIAGVLFALHREKHRNWTFRDFLLVLDSIDNVRNLLNRRPETARFFRDYDANPETFGNLLSTLRNIVIDYHAIAACWDHAIARPVSINAWMKGESVLLLGYDATKPIQFSVLNRALIYKLSQTILSLPEPSESNPERTWVFLDEATLLSRLPILTELLNTGAGKGCSVTLGFQTIQGMERVFGEKEAVELIGQCSKLAIFRLGNNPATAEWAASAIGRAEQVEWSRSYTSGFNTKNESTSSSIQERFAVRPETLQNIPQTGPEHGLHGFFLSDTYGVVDESMAGISGSDLQKRLSGKSSDSPLLRRPANQMTLRPWTAVEAADFGFVELEPSAAPKPKATPPREADTTPRRTEPPQAPPPQPAADFLDGISRFGGKEKPKEPQPHSATVEGNGQGDNTTRPTGARLRYKAFTAANADAIRQQGMKISQAAVAKIIEAANKHGRGSGTKRVIPILSKNGTDTPITPESQPLQHAARLFAAQVIIRWCTENGLAIAKRISPSGENVDSFDYQELVLEIHL